MFTITTSVITQLHYVIAIMLKPNAVGQHLRCCIPAFVESGSACFTTYLRDKEQRQSAERFKRTVNEARDALCVMLNQLYQYRQTAGLLPQQKALYMQCTSLIQAIQLDIEDYWAVHCTQQCRIPDEYLDNMRPVLHKKLDVFKKILYESHISQALAVAVIAPLSDFVTRKDARCITVHDMVYMEKLLMGLETLNGGALPTEECLVAFLVKANFNESAFVEYYYALLKNKLTQETDNTVKLQLLHMLADEWFMYLLADEPGRWKNKPGVILQLLEWVLCQWSYCFQQLQTAQPPAEPPANSNKSKKEGYRMVFSEDPPVISALLHLLRDSGLYTGSLKGLFQHVAGVADFPNAGNLNPEYLMKAGRLYKKEAQEIILLNYLPHWYQLAGGKLPGKHR